MTRSSMTLSFPPFTRAIKILIGINAGIFLVLLIMGATGQGEAAEAFKHTFAVVPSKVVHGHVYQLVTYGFLHETTMHLLFNMLGLWMFGSMLEMAWGSRKFWEFYFFGIVGAGITSVIIAYTIGGVLHLSPDIGTIGASGAVYAILMAAAMLFGDQRVFLFPFPFTMKLKYLVAILGFIALAGALGSAGGVANVAHLGGLLFGYLYVKFVPRRGLLFAFSETYYGMKNSYHRWKRKRAARRFQVYMRKHENDPKRFFPEEFDKDKDKRDDGPGGWVN